MQKAKWIAVSLILCAGAAHAALAFLVSQRFGTSVTGQSILVCTYNYMGNTFDRVYPIGSYCPPSVDVY